MLKSILGINWKTTLMGLAAIGGVITKIGIAYRTKDFQQIFSNGQELMTDISFLLVGIGLLKAKDQNVTGAGPIAVAVASDGSATNRAGDDVGTVKTAATGQSVVN